MNGTLGYADLIRKLGLGQAEHRPSGSNLRGEQEPIFQPTKPCRVLSGSPGHIGLDPR
jgi:hypothetical protein